MSGPKKPDPKELARRSQEEANRRFTTDADRDREAMAAAAAAKRAGKGPVGAGAASQKTPPPLPSKAERDAIREAAKRKGEGGPKTP